MTLTLRTKIHVATNIEIETPIAIVVKERCAGMEYRAEIRTGYMSSLRDICKSPVAIVVIKNVAPVLSDIEIGEAIIVVVTPHATKSICGSGNSRFGGYITECAVTIIAIERIAIRSAAFVKIAAIYKVNILKSITVEIGNADARVPPLPKSSICPSFP